MSRDMLYRESVVHRSGALPMKIYKSNHVKYHWHDEYEFLLAEHDGTVCSVGGRQIELKCGEGLMIKGGELHSLSLDVGKSVTAIVVHPSFWDGDHLLDRLSFTSVFRNDTESGQKITELLNRIKSCYYAKPTGCEFLLRSYFYSIFAILLECGEYEEIPRSDERQHSFDAVLFEYVHRHLDEELSLDTLSEISHFSKSYVIRLFKKNTGQTPTEYICRCRVELAKELLKEKSVTATALDCGFNNVSYFIRTFKRYTGVTPKSWRDGK